MGVKFYWMGLKSMGTLVTKRLQDSTGEWYFINEDIYGKIHYEDGFKIYSKTIVY
jgi:hypothetical protein